MLKLETKNYIINQETMSLFPAVDEWNQSKTIVIEEKGIMMVDQKPLDIIKESCSYFASSYEGRRKGTYARINVTRMAPILINDGQVIIFFPLMSPENIKCSWLSHQHIKKWWKVKNGTKVLFTNLQTLTLPIPFMRFEMQVYRSAQLRHVILESTRKSKPSSNQYIIHETSPSDKTQLLEKQIRIKDNGLFALQENGDEQ